MATSAAVNVGVRGYRLSGGGGVFQGSDAAVVSVFFQGEGYGVEFARPQTCVAIVLTGSSKLPDSCC